MPDKVFQGQTLPMVQESLDGKGHYPVVKLSVGDPAAGDAASQRLSTEPLGIPTVACQLPVSTTSNSVALTAACRRVSIRARGCDMRYVVGTGAQTADASTSHFIGQDERLDIAVPASATIAAIRESAATVNGSLAITELG